MDKQALRERVWDELEESGEARFPFPPHGRIPNFSGAERAADRLAGTEVWEDAAVLKSNPDSPQLPVRRRALREGKTVYMAVPRLRDEACFMELDPDAIEDIDERSSSASQTESDALDAAATVSSADEYAVRVGPEDVPPIDLIVSGSVAVNERGARIGKGEGYSDLEFAILREFGSADDDTTTVTTVHEIQVVDEEIPTTRLDVPIDRVFTPERAIRTDAPGAKPTGVDWDALGEERIEEIPVLEALKPE